MSKRSLTKISNMRSAEYPIVMWRKRNPDEPPDLVERHEIVRTAEEEKEALQKGWYYQSANTPPDQCEKLAQDLIAEEKREDLFWKWYGPPRSKLPIEERWEKMHHEFDLPEDSRKQIRKTYSEEAERLDELNLRAGRWLLRTQRLDELRDRGADLVGAVLLDEVRPVDRGLGEVGPRPDERADPAALDDHPRRRVDEQLRHIAMAQPIAVVVDVRHDIGGLAVDGDIARPRQRRPPRLTRLQVRLAILVHLFVAELAQNTSGKYRFDEEILFEHHGLALRR